MLSSSLTDFFTHSCLSLTHSLSLSLSLTHSSLTRPSRLAVPRWWFPRCCQVYPRYWSGSEGHVTTDRTRTLCLIPPCSCAKNTSLLHLSYFISYYLVLRSILLLYGERSRCPNTLPLNCELFSFTEWYEFSFLEQNALKLKFRYKFLSVIVTAFWFNSVSSHLRPHLTKWSLPLSPYD
jgi:hypothetical protein